jgi:hypothetical protein
LNRYHEARHVFDTLSQSLVEVRLVADVPELAGLSLTTSNLDGLPVIGLRESPHFGLNVVVKRVMDFVLSFLALVILSPLLLFMTNYDSSWDSYLGDFVDGASPGATGIWSNTGGFPRTWFLALGGGSRLEKQFKAYARKGQLRSSAWFSAYPNLSVQEKLSNAALRRGFEQRNRGNVPFRTPSIGDIAKQDDLLRRL